MNCLMDMEYGLIPTEKSTKDNGQMEKKNCAGVYSYPDGGEFSETLQMG